MYDRGRVPRGSTGVGQSNFAQTIPRWEKSVSEKSLSSTSWSRRIFAGVYATRKVCLRIPLLYLYGLLLYIPPIRNLAGKSNPGRNGDACDV